MQFKKLVTSIVKTASPLLLDVILCNFYSTKALLDTGSDINVISEVLCNKLKLSLKMVKTEIYLANGSKYYTKGHCMAQVKIGNIVNNIKFYIFDKCAYNCILGLPALKDLRIKFDFSSVSDNVFCGGLSTESGLFSDQQIKMSTLLEKSGLCSEQQAKMSKLLDQYKSIFSFDPSDLTQTNIMKHNIQLAEKSIPHKIRPYRTPQALKQEISKQIQCMLKNKIIKTSNSPWNSPCFLIPKKNGSYRFVIDYRKLNSKTIKDSFPLPHIDDVLMELANCKYFSTLDCASGYWQISLDDESKSLTAFEANGQLYEFEVMPFGLCNAPATFQRLMTQVLSGLKSIPYIDDILVASVDFENHLHDLNLVFERMQEARLKLQPTKCHFAAKEILYLGHLISKNCIGPDPNKISTLVEMTAPTSLKQTESFCGFANYLSRYVPNLAGLLKPIFAVKNQKPFKWSSDCQEAFEKTKLAIISATQLLLPNFSKPFELHVDASHIALGAALIQDGKPVYYHSKVLNRAQQNYGATDREFLGLIEGVKFFRPFLFGHKFTVVTDHKALTSILDKEPANSRHARYRQLLEEYDFEIVYIQGKKNVIPDALSRLVLNPEAKPFVAGISLKTVPENEIEDLCKTYHNAGHFGHYKVRRDLLNNGFWFPKMHARLREIQNNCQLCTRAKSYTSKVPVGSLPNHSSIQPREMVALDVVGPLQGGKLTRRFILTMIDMSSKWAEAVALTSVTTDSIIQAFLHQWLWRHGTPNRILTDNGSNFVSANFENYLKSRNIKHSRASVYHPEGNGVIERFHRTLKDRLRIAQLDGKNWVDALPEAVFHYNRSHHDSIEVSPFKFMYGSECQLIGREDDLSHFTNGSEYPCPRFVHRKLPIVKGSLSPRFGPPIRVEARISDQLVRTVDGNIIHLSNSKAIF